MYIRGVNTTQNYLNVKIMENLSKEVLINELNVKTAILEEIEKRIENGNIHNLGHRLFKWKYETIGAIDMLQLLINKIN